MTAVEENLTQSEQTSNIFKMVEATEHEQIVFCNDPATGLKSIIGIHDTTLGPALGGTRMWAYNNEFEALTDVLRLSRGMTLKAAISGVNLGGGKAVIIGNSRTDKSEALWRRYGRFVKSLGGKYITAEDVGTSTQDMEYVSLETEHVAGKPPYLGGGGDPSPVTAYGTYLGIKASVKEMTGSESLQGKTVAVQGVGHVGQYLVDLLAKDGCKIIVSDISEDNLAMVTKNHNVEVVGLNDIYTVDAEIYAPCALGATVNDETISQFKFGIIAGAANNQLLDEKIHGNMLKQKGILYAPDFLINAGGLCNCYAEVCGYSRERAMGFTEKIYDRTLEIYNKAKAEDITTHEAAVMVANERIQAVAKLKAKF